MEIKPNEPNKCIVFGLSAAYEPRYGGGYHVLINLSSIPKRGHALSYLHKKRERMGAANFIVDGEVKFIVERIEDIIEDEEPQPERVIKDFYCSTCFLQQYKVPCNPEDGAIMGYCPQCGTRKTWIHGGAPIKDNQS